jgi:hypothetical protein
MAKDLSRSREIHEVVGYQLKAYDGGLKAFTYWEVPQAAIHCPACNGTFDFEAVSKQVRANGPWQIASARGRIIVGNQVRDFCRRHGYRDVMFPILDSRRQLFELRPERLLEVDLERSQPILTDFCTRCGNFQCYLLGQGLFFRGVSEALPSGFYRTNIAFGCGMSKSPLVIVAPKTMRELRGEHLRGLKFKAVPFVDPDYTRRKAQILENALLASRESMTRRRPTRQF